MNNRILAEGFKYAIVGGIATISDISTLFVLVNYFEVYYLYGTIFGFATGSIINYFISVNWVFSSRRFRDNFLMEFGSYILISLLVLGFTIFAMWFLTDFLGLYYMYSRIALIFFTFALNFTLRKFFLHRIHHEEKNYS